jgi:hypothetical protein
MLSQPCGVKIRQKSKLKRLACEPDFQQESKDQNKKAERVDRPASTCEKESFTFAGIGSLPEKQVPRTKASWPGHLASWRFQALFFP